MVCKTSIKFNKTPAYYAARRYGWIDEIITKLIQNNKPKGYWTKEKCQEEALKYQTRIEFFKNNSGVFNKCVKKNWLNDVCSHMKNKTGKKPIGFYTKENCHEKALKYKTKMEFKEIDSNYYSASIRFGWLNDICLHMIEVKKPNGYWTYEKCKEESLKYKNITQFRKNCSSAYNYAKKNNYIKDLK
jgi:hypothetical protein